MSSKRIFQSCPGAKFSCVAKLEDHDFQFMGYKDEWAGAVANAVPENGKCVWGVVWEIETASMNILGGTESKTGDQYKHSVATCEVVAESGDRLKCVYFRRNPKGCDVALPSPQYLQLILNGAEEYQIDKSHLEMLRKAKTNGNTVITEGMKQALF